MCDCDCEGDNMFVCDCVFVSICVVAVVDTCVCDCVLVGVFVSDVIVGNDGDCVSVVGVKTEGVV